MHTFRRMIGLLVASTAIVLGLGAGQAHAATESADQLAAVQCKAINLGANVSNFGVGYAFNSNCSPSHPLVIQVQWIDAAGNVLNDVSAWLPPGQAGTWLTYSGNLQRPHDTRQTAHACIWVTQDVIGWLGGPLLTSGCFLRNS